MDKNYFFDLLEIFIAEFIGTGLLLFFGCMGLQQAVGVELTMLKVGFTFGCVIAMIVVMFGHISEGHFNPAVTVTAFILNKVTPMVGVMYICAQTLGGIAGFALLQAITPSELFDDGASSAPAFCCTIPHPTLNAIQAFLAEYVSTSALICCVCSIWDPRNTTHDSVPVKLAVIIIGIAMVEAPYTGCGLNPARSFAPALLNNVWTDLWIYILAPMAAGVSTPLFYKYCFMNTERRSRKSLSHKSSPVPSRKKVYDDSSRSSAEEA